MTREAFIRKWLANPQKQYNEQCRDEMRDDLDLVIESALRQPLVTNRTFSVDEVKILLEKQKKLCANEFIHAEMTMEQAKRRVLNAPIVSF